MASKTSGINKTGFLQVNNGIDEYHKNPKKLKAGRCFSASNYWVKEDSGLKRPGRKAWGPAFDEVFKGAYEYIDEDGTARLMVASEGNLYEVDSTTKTPIKAIARELIHMHTFRGKLWVNGLTEQFKVVKDVDSSVGLDSPSTRPTAAAGAGTGLTGSYAVRITFVIEESGVRVYESDPCDVSNSVTLSNENLSLSSVPVSSDSRVNARYIYRSEAGGAKYYYDGQISDNTTTTYTTNVIDASLGDEVEYTHAQPIQNEYSEGANERMFYLKNDKLYYSEIGRTDSYLEYVPTNNSYTLPGKGLGVGLKAVYNKNTGREDLYIFQEDAVSLLPQADPNSSLFILTRHFGGKTHESIVEYKGNVVFLSSRKTIELISGGDVIDITTRCIPDSMGEILNQSEVTAELIYDRFYAVSIQNDNGKQHNSKVWVADLTTLQLEKPKQAFVKWYPWDINAQFLIRRSDGTLLMFDNEQNHIFELRESYENDEDKSGNITEFTSYVKTLPFFGDSLHVMKRAIVMMLKGAFSKTIYITGYAWNKRAQTAQEIQPIESAFVAGISVMGSVSTKFKDLLETGIPSAVAGTEFSFKFESREQDQYFRFDGFELTYQSSERLL